MQTTASLMRERARNLLAAKQADCVLAWQSGLFFYDNTPAFFDSPEQTDSLAWNGFCGGNLSKYLQRAQPNREKSKTAVFCKPCETFSLNQMLKDNRLNRRDVLVIAVSCTGMLDINKLKASGIKGILSIQETEKQLQIKTLYGAKTVGKTGFILEKCLACQKQRPAVYDELLGEPVKNAKPDYDRFAPVEEVESMSAGERFAFWRGHLARCVRCNACRNVCPACGCVQCVFDNKNSGMDSKANSNSFEEQLFHIIRAYHVAGRCVDCGECARVCPQHIPLQIMNRKLIKDINEFYGEYQAGADLEAKAPLTAFQPDDIEPFRKRGG